MVIRYLPVALLLPFSVMLAGCRGGGHLGQRVSAEYIGCGGLIVIGLAIYALINIIGSNAETGTKVIWALVVFFLPLLGFILWALMGPRK